ncbi:hypothetical protein B0H19DRAFT_161653 [Mycena capillaripes]|nr:hypothetical protein B0H19DRAFT_161653 [Mycena capillaripes]
MGNGSSLLLHLSGLIPASRLSLILIPFLRTWALGIIFFLRIADWQLVRLALSLRIVLCSWILVLCARCDLFFLFLQRCVLLCSHLLISEASHKEF